MINNSNLFSLSKIIAYMLYGIFLNDRGIQKNIINNSKEEIIKQFKTFEKKIEKFNKVYPERLTLDVVKDDNKLKIILKEEEIKKKCEKKVHIF